MTRRYGRRRGVFGRSTIIHTYILHELIHMILLMVFKIYPHSKILSFSLSQAIYSRVARVCKSDQGGPHKFRDNWTSFLKTRLNCSVPGDHPFYFDEIQSTSGLIDGHFIYGVFTTPDNSISGSAICGFSIKDISKRYNRRDY